MFEIIFLNFCLDQNDSVFKKPLFSDNEDDEDADDVLSDDEKLGNWRKERFKRESFLSQVLFILLFFIAFIINLTISRRLQIKNNINLLFAVSINGMVDRNLILLKIR